MHIFLIIMLILLLIFAILLWSSVVVEVEYWGGRFLWSIRYFGIKILPRKKKEEDVAEDEDASEEDKKKKKEKKPKKKRLLADKIAYMLADLWEKADLVSDILSAAPPFLRRFARGITWDRIEVDFLIANEDAADCAIAYGRMQTLVQNILAQAGQLIRVRRKRVAIACDFAADKCRWDVRFRLKLRVGSTLAAAICFAYHYLKGSREMAKMLPKKK